LEKETRHRGARGKGQETRGRGQEMRKFKNKILKCKII
jgi:hypothetical protein